MLGMRENNEEEVNNILKECGRKFDEIEENIKKKVKEQLNSSQIEEKIKKILKKINFSLLGEKLFFSSDEDLFQVECFQKHIIFTSLQELKNQEFCCKECQKENKEQYPEKKEPKKEKKNSSSEEQKCEEKIKMSKKEQKNFEKSIAKKYLEDLKEKQQEDFSNRQQQIFEDAKNLSSNTSCSSEQSSPVQQGLGQKRKNSFNQNQSSSPASIQKIQQAYNDVRNQAIQLGTEMVQKYKQKHQDQLQDLKFNEDEALNSYIVQIIPEEIYEYYMLHLDQEELKKFFRQEARKVHPDKNCHPSCSISFRKITQIYQRVSKQRGMSWK